MTKQELESFALWYLPVVLVTYWVSGSIAFSGGGGVSFGSGLDFVAPHLGHLICAAWLLVNSQKHGLNRWLWGAFALGAHLFAVVLYFIYVASNHAIDQTHEG